MRYLEIGSDGRAFHETEGDWIPPDEVLYCDCKGVGRETWNPQNHSFEDKGNLFKHEWEQLHRGPACKIRRQVFVDVTNRPDAKLGMLYFEDINTFVVEAKKKTTKKKR